MQTIAKTPSKGEKKSKLNLLAMGMNLIPV